MGILDSLNPPIFNDPEEDKDRKKKKRSVVDDIRTVKKTYDQAKKVISIARTALTPGVIGGIVGATILFIIFIFFFTDAGPTGGLGGLGGSKEETSTNIPDPSTPGIPGFNITLTGPPEEENGVDLSYTVTITHNPSVAPPIETIELYDTLPSGATFLSSSGSFREEGGTRYWPLSEVINRSPFTILIRPNVTDTNFSYTVSARLIAGSGGGPSGGSLLPQTTFSQKTDSEQRQIAARINSLPPTQIAAYQDAEKATGVAWQILAGIHYREGDLNGNNSLVSGRPIGSNEPDIERGGGCSSTYTPGEPVALSGGGCGFRTFTDSAIYAANHFKGKNGGTPPSTYQELTKSLSYYNGGGNANCGKTPYMGCPPTQVGEDDSYVMTFFDAKHESMYVVYCADFTLCDPPRSDSRLGVASVIMALSRF